MNHFTLYFVYPLIINPLKTNKYEKPNSHFIIRFCRNAGNRPSGKRLHRHHIDQ